MYHFWKSFLANLNWLAFLMNGPGSYLNLFFFVCTWDIIHHSIFHLLIIFFCFANNQQAFVLNRYIQIYLLLWRMILIKYLCQWAIYKLCDQGPILSLKCFRSLQSFKKNPNPSERQASELQGARMKTGPLSFLCIPSVVKYSRLHRVNWQNRFHWALMERYTCIYTSLT